MARRLKEPTFIRIFCEQKRASDMRWKFRPVHSEEEPRPGTCYAQRIDGRWSCCCCGKPVSVVW